jgi:glycerol-3-phosphate dehydrogenase
MNRDEQLLQLKQTDIWDIIIIGGGATGLGAAVDAANRGLKTLLVEKYDFAKGTSSRSTKLLHGGVRYLAQGNIKLVKSALRERGLLLQNAPHLAKPITFVIPAIRWYDTYFYGIGLILYDFLAGKLGLSKTKFTNKKNICNYLPTLNNTKINGGVLYEDGQFDDARFAINLAQTAIKQGATIINYANVIGLIKENNIIKGVTIEDTIHQKKYVVKAKVVINATGVFVEKILALDDEKSNPILSPSQGVHIVVDSKFFSGANALMIPKTKDGRVLFAVPWHSKVVIGTTDTLVKKVSDEPIALQEEIDFIIDHFNLYNKIRITNSDVLSVFVGLRPLLKKENIKSTASLNRDHTIIISTTQLITITGGKWTTYRKMAADVIDKAFAYLQKPYIKCGTENLHLQGYTLIQHKNEVLHCYGSDATAIELIMKNDIILQEKIHDKYNYTTAQIIWAMQNEMAVTIEDVLARRIRLLFLDAKSAIEAAPKVAKIMSTYLQKNNEWEIIQIEEFNIIAKNYLLDKN